jgi:hypothetical protein
MVESAGAASRKGTRLVGVLISLVAVAILASMVVYAILDALELANRASCQSNLKIIGSCMNHWASSHDKTWPDEKESDRWDEVGNTRTDAWSPTRDTGEPPAIEAADNGLPPRSNTAPLWRLVRSADLPPVEFVCPSVGYRESVGFDDSNLKLRDFRGETFINYSYQNVTGPYRLMSKSATALSKLPIVADANPMRRDFWSGAPGGVRNGVTDRMLAERPVFEETDYEDAENTPPWNQQTKFIRHPWELNSPNHKFKGQSVLYLDGHCDWREHPYAGPKYDNIWLRRRTDVSVPIDPKNIETLRAYNDKASYDGKSTLPEDSQDDSFLVP